MIKQPGAFLFFNVIFLALLASFYFMNFLSYQFYVFWFFIYLEMLQAAWIHKEKPGKIYHPWIYITLGILLNFLIVISITEHFIFARNNILLLIIGILLAIAALVVRHFGVRNLGVSFSEQIKIPEKIITTGLYGYIRHPIYISSMLYVFSLPLILGSYFSLSLSLLICLLLYIRADLEEDILLHSKDYKEYSKKTGKFLPRLRANHSERVKSWDEF